MGRILYLPMFFFLSSAKPVLQSFNRNHCIVLEYELHCIHVEKECLKYTKYMLKFVMRLLRTMNTTFPLVRDFSNFPTCGPIKFRPNRLSLLIHYAPANRWSLVSHIRLFVRPLQKHTTMLHGAWWITKFTRLVSIQLKNYLVISFGLLVLVYFVKLICRPCL